MKKNRSSKFTYNYYFKGQMLIGVLVAIAIFAILSHALFTLISASYSLVSMNRARITAKYLAQDRIERIRNFDYNDVGTIGGIPEGIIEEEETVNRNGLSFDIKTTILYIDDPYDETGENDFFPDYKRASVEVSWEGFGGSKKNPLKMITDISPKMTTSIAGTGTLSISVCDALGNPVSQASIQIIAESLNINSQYETSSDGFLNIPGSLPCNECYKIYVSKEGYSQDRTYSTTEVTNPLKPHATIIENKLTQVSFTIDKTASLTVNTFNNRESNFTPLGNVSFVLRGNKIIGSDAYGQVVYKYEQTLLTDEFGLKKINSLEWDFYTIQMPEISSYDISGTYPLIPISLLPNSEESIEISLNSHSTNSLLFITRSSSSELIPETFVKIEKNGNIDETTSGKTEDPDYGQAFFPNMDIDSYSVEATASGYQKYNGSVDVDGYSKFNIIMTPQ